MLNLAGFDFPLPENWAWLNAPVWQFVINVVFWLLVGLLVYVLFFRIAKRLVRSVRGGLDDTLIDIVRRPLLIGIVVFGLANALFALALTEQVDLWVEKIRDALLIILLAWAVWRLFNEIVIYYGQRLALRSTDRIDDILLPILQQFGRIIILVLTLFFSLRYLGLDLSGLWIAIGGAAFILGFALQDILGNMFASLAMLVDTPFQHGDLISPEDGNVYRVERIGVRVTELYDTFSHTVVFMPNGSLTGKQLTNLTRPTMDIRTHIKVVVPVGPDPLYVAAALREAAESHPNILSPIPHKLDLMRERLTTFEAAGHWERVHEYVGEMTRLQAEHRLDQAVADIDHMLESLADHIDEMEEDGLDERERTFIAAGIEQAHAQIHVIAIAMTRWLMAQRFRMARPLEEYDQPVTVSELCDRAAAYMEAVDREIAAQQLPLLGTLPNGHISQQKVKRAFSPLVRRNGFEGFDRGFKDVQTRSELEVLLRTWDYRICDLRDQLDALRVSLRSGNEQRLDDTMRMVEDWLHTLFKDVVPVWKFPDVALQGIEGGSMIFQLDVQIDNVNLEFFGRQTRVESELRKDVLHRLRQQGIAL